MYHRTPVPPEHRAMLRDTVRRLHIAPITAYRSLLAGSATLVRGQAITPAWHYRRPLARAIRRWHQREPFGAVLTVCTGMARYARSWRHRPVRRVSSLHPAVVYTPDSESLTCRGEPIHNPRKLIVEPWIFMLHSPGQARRLEYWLDEDTHKRAFDAWEDGGVRGLVIGNIHFTQDDGTAIPPFRSDPKIYESFGLDQGPPPPRDPEKEKRLYRMLDNAASRGWRILCFRSCGVPTGSLPPEEDPFRVVPYAASLRDMVGALPQIHGHIIDGPGENHYELDFHHGGEVFEMRDGQNEQWAHLGIDLERAERGMLHLRKRFHELTPSRVRYHAPGGMLASLALFDLNDDALYWLRARREFTIGFLEAVRHQVDQLDRKVLVGGIPRTATFSALTGQDYGELGRTLDYVFPKHYFWHRGFDGMVGTIARWVTGLSRWNPTLTEEDCFAVVKALFGIELPGINSIADMERGFPDEFFSKIVHGETRRALEAVGDPDKVIAWVSTGRNPHGGDPMPAHDLQRILTESQRAGLKRFLFHSTEELGAAEWRVISGLCGNLWDEEPEGYWPQATDKPDTWNGGRQRPASNDR